MAAKKVVKKAAKKAPAKKAAPKKAAKKVVKKVAKKSAPKKTAKKAVKKAPAKRTVKKAVAKKPVAAVAVTSAAASAPAKPVAAPVVAKPTPSAPAKSGGSNRVVLAVVIGVLALGAIVLSRGSSGDDKPMPMDSSTPTASASATASQSTAVTTVAAPLGIVAHYTATGATIFWNATTAADGLKGYSVEFRSNGGTWTEVATVGTDVTKYDITKGDSTGWTSFKISAVYNDGQKAEGKVFGLPGQYK